MAVDLMVAGWFVSVVISKVADLILENAKYKINCHKNIKSNLEELKQLLMEIESVIGVTDQGELNNPSLQDWLFKLKYAVYDAEDVVDNFNYDILRKKVMGNSKKGGDAIALDNIVKTLRGLAKGTERFLIAVKHNDNKAKNQHATNWRVRTAGRSQPTLVGRNTEENALTSFLLEPVSNGEEHFSTISMFGIAGVGKTALARFAYHDETVKNNFAIRAWVSVTHTFDVKSLTIKCIESASIKRPRDLHQIQDLDEIQGILEEALRGKKFLVVLDDVWSDDGIDEFLEPLRVGEEGSRVLVTTRHKSLANKLSTSSLIHLKGLKSEECWDLLSHRAFRHAERPYPVLEDIGKEIAKGLGGLPLVAETIGSVLREELREDHWREIMTSNIYEVVQPMNRLLRTMRLSYEQLPDGARQQCFLSCSLFSSDHKFRKTELVRIWMALGFLSPKETNKTMEAIGSRHFDEFVNRQFFMKVKTESTMPDVAYEMNRAFHQLAEYLSGGEYFRVDYKEGYGTRNSNIVIPDRARHVHLDVNDVIRASASLKSKTNLRTLIITGRLSSSPKDANLLSTLEKILKELKCLRVLLLSDLIPGSFDNVRHLRYFKVGSLSDVNNNTITLPEWLCKCYHLQTLAAEFDCKQMSLPKHINRLIMLRWLDTKPETRHKIAGIGKMISLMEVGEFQVQRKGVLE